MRRLAIALVTLASIACQREAVHPRATRVPPRAPKAARDEWENETLPSRDAYAGSDACGDCHAKNHERWSHDWHARALSAPSAATVAGKYDRAHFRGTSSEAWMTQRRAQYFVRTRDREGKVSDYRVSWLIGGKRMQDGVTVFPDGRWQVLPVYFHVTGGGAWVDYNEVKQGRVTPEHPFFWTNFRRTANRECLDCHTTGLDVRYDRAQHSWSTAFADAGVACEACHGPGARHAETKDKRDIVQPAHLTKDRALAICGRCHGPREPLFPLLDAKHRFRPGDAYAEHFQALVINDGTERSGEYFADGRPSSSSFEYQALLQSRCYVRGGATCLTCHTAPHAAQQAADEIRHDPNASCRDCHKDIQGAAHSHHQTATCTDCHMPKLVSGVLDKFADHTIDVPNPANTTARGAPNACNGCHVNRSSDEMQRAMQQWWPSGTARQQRRSTLAAAFDEKTAASSFAALAATIGDESEAPTLRGAAANIAAQRFPSAAPPVLLPLLHSADPLLRAKAVESLGYANARGAADAIAPLLEDGVLSVRQLAALVLSTFGDDRGNAAIARLASDPTTRALVRPHIVLAIAHANRGEYDAAEQELRFVVDEVPYATDALVMLADIRMRRNDRAGARAWLEEALRFNPAQRGAIQRLHALAR